MSAVRNTINLLDLHKIRNFRTKAGGKWGSAAGVDGCCVVLVNVNVLMAVIWCRCPFAVPDKIFGLALILDFIDRCTTRYPTVSATGSVGQRGREDR